nr:reverse transcriptase domain-containing protein [Tanacetum cinerariifolium]
MHTRNSYFSNNSSVTIPRRRNKRRAPDVVEPDLRTIIEVTPMADNRTMEELLQAPTEGYGEAIVIPKNNAHHFEIKTNLLQLVQANPYHGFERENPHIHINNFKRITSTLKFKDVPNDVIKLIMFSFSLEGADRVWVSASKMDDRIDKLADQISTLVEIVSKKVVTPATVKAIEESCVTCGGNHAYYNCDATNNNQSSVCATTGIYNQVAPQNRASNFMALLGFAPVQNGQNRFNQNQGQENNFNRGNNFHDKTILSGADNRPPMLEKDMYDSWKSIMELYMLNRQHDRMILESVEQGPLLWPTVEEDGVARLKKYSELFAVEALQADCDVKATNIILQGLPPEVYAL